ncbi:MAG: DUF6364 family protein [bacterium]|nr:DUF6364 family protein [bacterium]
MTRNITVAVDSQLLKKVRKIAVDKETTVTGLIREYLETLVLREDSVKKEIISELSALLDRSEAVVGDQKWTRDDLHDTIP